MLTPPHKSPVVRGSVAQMIDGNNCDRCKLPVFHLVVSPTFLGELRSHWLSMIMHLAASTFVMMY